MFYSNLCDLETPLVEFLGFRSPQVALSSLTLPFNIWSFPDIHTSLATQANAHRPSCCPDQLIVEELTAGTCCSVTSSCAEWPVAGQTGPPEAQVPDPQKLRRHPMDEVLRHQVDGDEATTPGRGRRPHPGERLAADIAGDHYATDRVSISDRVSAV